VRKNQHSAWHLPRGWKVEYLPKVIDVNPARSLVKGGFAPYLEMSNMPTSSARAIQWETREFTSGMKFINGDTLLARITPCLENGKTAYVDFLLEGQVGWGSTEYIVFHSKEQLPPEYTYFLARSEDLRAHAIKNMTGTSGRQRVPAECFNSYSIVVPQQEIAWKFGEIAKICLAAIKQRDEETNILASLRDTLLPKLISGQVRVKDAEKIAEALPSMPVHDKSREIIQGRLFS
jgi:type I restriction enzyme S subunit